MKRWVITRTLTYMNFTLCVVDILKRWVIKSNAMKVDTVTSVVDDLKSWVITRASVFWKIGASWLTF